MKTVKGIFLIILFLVAGNVCSMLMKGFIPGSVCGMVLLFVALAAKIVKPDQIRDVADFLTKNMTVFFIPASIGIMDQWDVISGSLIGWTGVIFISTICVLVITGLTQDGFIRLSNKFGRRKGND